MLIIKAAVLISILMGTDRKFWGISHNTPFLYFLLTNMFSHKPGMALYYGNDYIHCSLIYTQQCMY